MILIGLCLMCSYTYNYNTFDSGHMGFYKGVSTLLSLATQLTIMSFDDNYLVN